MTEDRRTVNRHDFHGSQTPSATWSAATRRAALLLTLAALSTFATAQVHVELILDASGSMYNRLGDGRYRIEAAKQVLVDLIAGLPAEADLHVGLRVYGARLQAGDDHACEDSHLEVPILGVDRAALRGTVESTLARGATPIAYSLQLAAEDLPTSGSRRVVLVTDGLESCGGDLAAIAQLYADLGIDLKIVGFDLDETAAAAFAAIADFENALSAEELAGALQEALGDVAVASVERVPVVVTVTRGGEATSDGVTVAFVSAVDSQRVPLAATAVGRFEAELPPGGYVAELIDAFADGRVTQISGLSVEPVEAAVFTFELAPEFAVTLSVAQESPTAGSRVTVDFSGAPAETLGLIALAPAGSADAIRLYQAYVSTASGSVELLTPDTPGSYEARFYLTLPEGGHRVIGRSALFETSAATASLVAPQQVAAGTRFEIMWTGPAGQGDMIVMEPLDGTPAVGRPASTRTYSSPATFQAPTAEGEYELRYLTGQTGTVLATLRVEVIAAVVTITAPAEVAADTFFDVFVGGAVAPQDAIILVRAGAPDQGAETFGPARRVYGPRVQSRAPAEPGEYELRYVNARGEVLQRLPLTVR